MKRLLCILTTGFALAEMVAPLSAQTVTKANNTTDLHDGASWLLGEVPDDTQIALWDNTVTAANITAIGGDLSWLGIEIANAGGNVTINGTSGSKLTLGSGGISLTSNRDLTIGADVELGANQVWNTAARALAVNGIISGSGNLTKQGSGTLTLSTGNLYTGNTVIEAGTVSFSDFTAFGNATTAIVLGTSSTTGTLTKTGTTAATTTRNIDLQGNGTFVIDSPSTITVGNVSSSVAGEKTFRINVGSSTGTHLFSGNISDGVAGSTVNLVKGVVANARDFTLQGTLNISGYLEVAAGPMSISRATALGDETHAGLNGLSMIKLSGGNILYLNSGAMLNLETGFEISASSNIRGSDYDLKGGITLTSNSNVTLTFGAVTASDLGTDNIISGVVSDGTGTGTLGLFFRQATTSGLNTIYTLTGENTYTGLTTIERGSVQIETFQNLGNATSSILLGSGAYIGNIIVDAETDTSTNRGILLNGSSGGGGRIRSIGEGAVTINGGITAGGTGAITLTLDGDGTGKNTITGLISDNSELETNTVGIQKSQAGTWILSGDNTYTGTTAVGNGTLLINGDQSAATGAVTVNAAGTLGGSGIIGGDTTVSGTLSPGNSPGTLTFDGNLTLDNGSTYLFEGGDLVDVGGTLTLNNSWTLALSGPELAEGGSVVIFTFSTLAADPYLIPVFDTSGLDFTPNSLSLSLEGNSLVLYGVHSLDAIPEPSTVALLFGIGGAMLIFRRRRVASPR